MRNDMYLKSIVALPIQLLGSHTLQIGGIHKASEQSL